MNTSDGGIAVRVHGAAKTFDRGVQALALVDMAVGEGEFIALIGPSGCGKSTLLRLVAGLAAPSAGRVDLWPGRAAGSMPRPAFVFQTPTLMPWASVERNVRLPLDLGGTADAAGDAAVEHALELVGLAEFRRAFPRELSGGMQMRVSIARALVTRAPLLLMDEPFGALDEITRSRLDDDLSRLWAAQGLTVLFVTHSVAEAVRLSTRVVVMSARPGRIVGEVAVTEPFPRTDEWRAGGDFGRSCLRVSTLLAAGSDGDRRRAAHS